MALLNLILLPLLAALGLFETNGQGADDGGATGAAEGSGNAQGSGSTATTTADATEGATSEDDDGQGAGSKAALKVDLARERDRRQATERERDEVRQRLEQLESASKTDHEKAVDAARKEAEKTAAARYEGMIRRSEVRSALAAAGCNDPAIVSLAPEFAQLKITDDGEVEGLASAVKKFKAEHGTLFTARVPSGDADQGAKPADNQRATTLEDAYTAHYAGRTT